jgi:glyoxylase-like metal-dependent hydrolase (beta-lactamase superfamily II)
MTASADGIQRWETGQGAEIYRVPLDLFPELSGFVHVVRYEGNAVLFDVGSGFGSSNEQLEDGLNQIQVEFGERVGWSDITHIVISHGHIDHFGGLGFVRQRCSAPVIVHSLDRHILTHYEERLALVAGRLDKYLGAAGVDPERAEGIMAMYMLNKELFRSQPVDLTCEQLGMHLGRMGWVHVPGHCPGQIVARLDDVLLSADHVLATTSPHQAPESLTLSTGLNHYLESLAKLRLFSSDVRLTLGGHEGPVIDLDGRIREIAQVHRDRLMDILALTQQACTIDTIMRHLFPTVEGYHQLLAVEEAGAHVEYLHQRGFLTVENFEEIENGKGVPVRYKRTEGDDSQRLEASFSDFEQRMQMPDLQAEVRGQTAS